MPVQAVRSALSAASVVQLEIVVVVAVRMASVWMNSDPGGRARDEVLILAQPILDEDLALVLVLARVESQVLLSKADRAETTFCSPGLAGQWRDECVVWVPRALRNRYLAWYLVSAVDQASGACSCLLVQHIQCRQVVPSRDEHLVSARQVLQAAGNLRVRQVHLVRQAVHR